MIDYYIAATTLLREDGKIVAFLNNILRWQYFKSYNQRTKRTKLVLFSHQLHASVVVVMTEMQHTPSLTIIHTDR